MTKPEMTDLTHGVWIAYYPGIDGGPGVPFATEVEALRHALDYSMKVKFARYGDADWTTRREEDL